MVVKFLRLFIRILIDFPMWSASPNKEPFVKQFDVPKKGEADIPSIQIDSHSWI